MIRRIPRAELRRAPTSIAAFELKQAISSTAQPPADRKHEALAAALRALLSEELTLKPEHIERVVERELLRARRARVMILHVHPHDAALLEPTASYVERLALRGTLSIVEDATVTRGGCVLHSNLGEQDARLETRLAAALELLAAGAFDEP